MIHPEASLASLGALPGLRAGTWVWTVHSLSLESSILVDVPFAAIDPVFAATGASRAIIASAR